MPISREEKTKVYRFPFPLVQEAKPKKGDKEEWVTLRKISPNTYREIEKLTSKVTADFKQPEKSNGKIDHRAALQRVEYKEVDETERTHLIWDALIAEIHIYDNDGKLWPSTKSSKLDMMGNNTGDFAVYIGECSEILTADDKTQLEELTKNLSSSPSVS